MLTPFYQLNVVAGPTYSNKFVAGLLISVTNLAVPVHGEIIEHIEHITESAAQP